jgi:hypothetical protein
LSGTAGRDQAGEVEPSQPIPARELERMMKLQDMILKAMAKKITWIDAAEIAGMSVRNMQRKRQGYAEYGRFGGCQRTISQHKSGSSKPFFVSLLSHKQNLQAALFSRRYLQHSR